MAFKHSAPQKTFPIDELLSRLEKAYPDASCALSHDNPLQLLIATILSAQCTDERVNLVTKNLFKKYRTANDFAQADPEIFAREIHSTGFFQNKTKNVIGCAQKLMEKHGGEVPHDLESLISLPGVGRKTANVVLGNAFGIASGVVVDTHVRRLSGRLGLTLHNDPEKIEYDLQRLVPQSHWILFSHLLILHGRNRCNARKPDCENCEVTEICLKNFEGHLAAAPKSSKLSHPN
ncbi:MAG: endonuclease III [Candidatus Ozemobacteraceae bacterium]